MSQSSESMQIDIIENTENTTSQEQNVVCSPIKRRRNESPVWEYVIKLENGNKKCNIEFCTKVFEKSTGTSSIMYHLKDAHSISCCIENSIQSASHIKQNNSKHGVEEQSKRIKALLDFIIKTFQALSVVNAESFLIFCYLMDPRFIVPERHTVSNYLDKEFETSLANFKLVLNSLDSTKKLIDFV